MWNWQRLQGMWRENLSFYWQNKTAKIYFQITSLLLLLFFFFLRGICKIVSFSSWVLMYEGYAYREKKKQTKNTETIKCGLRIAVINIFDWKSIYRYSSPLTGVAVIQKSLNLTDELIRTFTFFCKWKPFFILLSADWQD